MKDFDVASFLPLDGMIKIICPPSQTLDELPKGDAVCSAAASIRQSGGVNLNVYFNMHRSLTLSQGLSLITNNLVSTFFGIA